jgi:hypothetical protein
MPRTCTVCSHDQRGAIEQEIAATTSAQKISALFRVSPDAVQRHKAEHLPKTLTEARKADDDERALDVVKQLRVINGVSLQILNEARQGKDPQTALKAVDRIHRQIELQAKLLGQLGDRPQINLLMAPEWLQVRTALLMALAPYTEARQAVAAALVSIEAAPAIGAA